MPVVYNDVITTPIAVELLIDTPWMSVAKVVYEHGTRFDLTWSQETEPSDFTMFYADILPGGSLVMGTRMTDTLPDSEGETTVSFWVAE